MKCEYDMEPILNIFCPSSLPQSVSFSLARFKSIEQLPCSYNCQPLWQHVSCWCVLYASENFSMHTRVRAKIQYIFHKKLWLFRIAALDQQHMCVMPLYEMNVEWLVIMSASVCACTFFDDLMWPMEKLFSCAYGFVLWQTIQKEN